MFLIGPHPEVGARAGVYTPWYEAPFVVLEALNLIVVVENP